MNRQDFSRDVKDVADMIEFCKHYNLSNCDDIISNYEAFEIIRNSGSISEVLFLVQSIYGHHNDNYFSYTEDGLYPLSRKYIDDLKFDIENAYDELFGFDENDNDDDIISNINIEDFLDVIK